MDYEQKFPGALEKDGPDFRTILDRYLKYWPWFVGSVILCLIISYMYLKVNPNIYRSVATIIIKDEEGKGPSGEETALGGLSLLGGISTSSIENELGLLRSKRLMENAVKALNLNIQYFEEDGFFKKEFYKDSPYIIRPALIDENELLKARGQGKNMFTIEYISENEVALNFDNQEESIIKKLGEVVNLDYTNFYIEANPQEKYRINNNSEIKSIQVVFSTVEGVASSLGGALQVYLMNENSTLIELSMENEIKEKAKDVLDQLIFEYNQEAIEDKDLIARNTAYFIDERLAIINSELDSVETGKEEFKESNMLTDINTESSLIVKNVSDYNNQKQQIATELELTSALISHLTNNSANLLPTNLGIDDTGVNSLISEYNSRVLERNKLRESASDQNPMIVSLESQIEQIRSNVMESLKRRQYNLQVKKNNLDRQSGVLASQISDVPAQERAYRGIERQQNIKESLYLYLLQKREENSLALAAKAPKAKLVDKAYSYGTPVSPNSKIVFTVGLLFGLFIPFATINIKSLLNNKITNGDDLSGSLNDIPLYAEIPHFNSSDVSNIPKRNILSEVFNILSANIGHTSSNQCILVTSSIKGEGKTFISTELALSYASGNNKVLLIGLDLRNPQIQKWDTSTRNKPGLSNYLTNDNLEYRDVIFTSSRHNNLYILPSGNIPKNPVSLLKSDKLTTLIKDLKPVYDYIIIDTAPVMLVADTLLLSNFADITLYIMRASFTKKKLIGFVNETKNKNKFNNMGIVLNDVKVENSLYGNSYGY